MLERLKERRSIRKYAERPIEKEKVENLLKAALLAPSSKKSQPWEFIVIDDKEILSELSRSKEKGAGFVKDAPMAILVMADPEKSDVWVEDTSIASTLIQLQAHSMGLGSCWVQVRNRKCNEEVTAEKFIKNLLSIPDKICVEALITVGYPDESKRSYEEDDLNWNIVFSNQYGIKK
ncbi:Nitroreductase [Tindallia magadiensis]|uniref:Nitroreductase n=1 Tax=Tindallia magadiensis TaxID=69895 RepID=A0A1I3FZ20_9FIRM|nr:nitroreductase family protein [Tindallia magadiensis]SFI16434.1 Nitroreductase [Tindallia magadiensis]